MNIKTSTLPIAGLITAEFLSLLGNQVAAVAIPVLVWHHTQSPMITGIAVVAGNISFVVAAFIGGRSIQRFGAWRVSIAADLLSCVSVLALPVVFILYPANVSPALIFLLIFVGALFDPTGVAARHTFIPVLARLARKRLDKVNSLRGSLENAADFIGPAIGAGLISFINFNYTLFVNAISFLLCAVLFVLTIPRKRQPLPEKSNSDIFFGVRFIFKNSVLRTLAITGIISGFVISAFIGLLLLLLATQRFHHDALFAISLSALGITATISALTFSTLNRFYSHSFIYYGGLLIIGIGIGLCGVVSTPYGVIASAALAGVAGAGNPLEQTILQEQTSAISAGPVFAALPAIRFASGSLGLLVAALLTELYSVNTVLLLAAGSLIITAIAGFYIAPLDDK